MGFRFAFGNGYFGSADIMTSTVEQEIIQQHKPAGWTIPFRALKMSFKPYANCHIKINDGDQIFWEANEVLNIDFVDAPISSFVIVEADIPYRYFFEY